MSALKSAQPEPEPGADMSPEVRRKVAMTRSFTQLREGITEPEPEPEPAPTKLSKKAEKALAKAEKQAAQREVAAEEAAVIESAMASATAGSSEQLPGGYPQRRWSQWRRRTGR